MYVIEFWSVEVKNERTMVVITVISFVWDKKVGYRPHSRNWAVSSESSPKNAHKALMEVTVF